MRESEIEAALKRRVSQAGGDSYKWVSPGLTGVPDQIVLIPVPPELQSIVAQYIRFVELKAPGKTPTPRQRLIHKQLRDLGYQVFVADTLADVDKIVSEI